MIQKWKRLVATTGIVALGTIGVSLPASGSPPQRVTICHIAGHAAPHNANEITLTLSEKGLRGHFDERGTPLAGHEEDYMGECKRTQPPI
jgi:hypothetical protein